MRYVGLAAVVPFDAIAATSERAGEPLPGLGDWGVIALVLFLITGAWLVTRRAASRREAKTSREDQG